MKKHARNYDTVAAIDEAVKSKALMTIWHDNLGRFTTTMEGRIRSASPSQSCAIVWQEMRNRSDGSIRYNACVYVKNQYHRCTHPLTSAEECRSWYEHFKEHLGYCTRLFGGLVVDLPKFEDTWKPESADDEKVAEGPGEKTEEELK